MYMSHSDEQEVCRITQVPDGDHWRDNYFATRLMFGPLSAAFGVIAGIIAVVGYFWG